MYVFTIIINGQGDNADEAWADAVTALSMDPGSTPGEDEYEIEED